MSAEDHASKMADHMARDAAADRERLKSIHAVAAAGHFAAAALEARIALSEGLEHPFLLNLAASALEESGDLSGALALLERAVALAPTDLGARNALGLCLRRLERPLDAVPHLRWVVQRAPEHAFAHASLGDVLQMIGALAEADACYAAALARDPQHPIALAGRAAVAGQRGDSQAARDYATAALQVMPDLPDAIIALAAAESAEGEQAAAALRLRRLIEDERVAPLQKARALGTLGDVLDASLQPHLAFVAYEECNQLLREAYAPKYEVPRNAAAYAEELLAYFDRADPALWVSKGRMERPAGGHVFLIGFPRSGTTLLEVVLEGHPGIVTLEERELFLDSAHRYMSDAAGLDALAAASEDELNQYRAAYWSAVRSCGVNPDGRVFVDKYPLNILKLPLIARLFPDARILLARRDPRDVVLSAFRRRFLMNAPMYELLTLAGGARFYDRVMRIEQRLLAFFDLHPHVIGHEALLDDFDGEMRRICAYLGIEWTAKMGEFAERAKKRPSATPSTAQLAGGLSRRGLGHWRRYGDEMASVLPLLAPWVKAFGYE